VIQKYLDVNRMYEGIYVTYFVNIMYSIYLLMSMSKYELDDKLAPSNDIKCI